MSHRYVAVIAACVCLAPVSARAQGGQTTPAAQGQGPMIVERVKSGFVFAPDVKVTRFDRRTSELIGGYAGWLSDQSFFIGGGGYWMANHSRDRQLAYGGVVVGVQTRANNRIGFGVKGLVGAGRATTLRSVSFYDDRDLVHIQNVATTIAPRIIIPTKIVANTRVREPFLLAEPEGHVIFNLSKRFRLTAGAGYRFAGSRERGVRTNLNGATGSVALQIGTGGA